MRNRPSILTWTPQEHLEEQWINRPALPVEPPPNHVRVYLFPDWEEGDSDEELVDARLFLQGDFSLDPSGGLSLVRVRKAWGLEKCAAIDPNRRKMFVGSDPDYLSPLAVRVLTDEKGILKLFEPEPSEDMLLLREDRLKIVRQYRAALCRLEDYFIAYFLENIWMQRIFFFTMLFLVLFKIALPIMGKVAYYFVPDPLALVPIMLPRTF